MFSKLTVSIRTLLLVVTLIAALLAADRRVESKAARFLTEVNRDASEIIVEIDGDQVEVSDAYPYAQSETTSWIDRLLLRRKFELKYSASFVMTRGGVATVNRCDDYVLKLIGPPRKRDSHDFIMVN